MATSELAVPVAAPPDDGSDPFAPIREFAKAHRLHLRLDSCDDLFIPGRKIKQWDKRYPPPNVKLEPAEEFIGNIYQWSFKSRPVMFGLMFMPRRPRLWKHLRVKLLAAGFLRNQNGDWEGSLLFDPADKLQARLAIKAIGAYPIRRCAPPSEKQIAARQRFAESATKKADG